MPTPEEQLEQFKAFLNPDELDAFAKQAGALIPKPAPKMTPAQVTQAATAANMSPIAASAQPAPEEMPVQEFSMPEQKPMRGSEIYSQLAFGDPKKAAEKKALLEALLKEQEETVKKQEGAIDKQEALAQLMMSKGPQTNLSPILGLIDTWTGSKLTEGYKPPQTAQDSAVQAFTLQDKINQLRGDLTKTQQGFLRDRLKEIDETGGFDPNKFAALQYRESEQDRRSAQYEIGKQQDLEKSLETQLVKPITMKMAEDGRALNQMDEALKTGSFQALKSSLGPFSRIISSEKGVLREEDIQRTLPKNWQGTVAEFLAFWSEKPDAAISLGYSEPLRNMINLAKKTLHQKYNSEIQAKKQMWSAPKSRMNTIMGEGHAGKAAFDAAENILSTTFNTGAPQRATAAMPPPGLTKEQFLEWRKANATPQ